MAKNNNRKINSYVDLKKEIIEQKSSLTLEEIVNSTYFNKYIEAGTDAIFKAHNRRKPILFVVDYNEKRPTVACTDNYTCYVNAAHRLFTNTTVNGMSLQSTLDDSCKKILGARFHEIGHILYTSFSQTRKCMNDFSSGLMEEPEGLSSEDRVIFKEIESIMKNEKMAVIDFNGVTGNLVSGSKDFIAFLAMGLANSMEDGRIEKLLLTRDARFAGYCNGLRMLRDEMYEAGRDVNEFSDANLCTFVNMVLMMSKYGKVEGYDGSFAEFEKAKPYIEKAVVCHEAKRFWSYVTMLIICAWPLIEPLVVELPEDEGNSGKGDDNGESGEKSDESSEGGSGSGKNNNSEDTDSNNGGSSAGKSGNSEKQDDGKKDDSKNGSDKSDNSQSEQNEQSEQDKQNGNSDEAESQEKSPAERMKELMEQLEKMLPEESKYDGETEDIGENSEVSTEADVQDGVSGMIDSIAGKIAEENVKNKAAKEGTENAKSLIRSHTVFSPYNGKIEFQDRLYISNHWEARLEYARDNTGKAVKKAAKEIQRHLERDMRTGVSRNKYFGKKFHANKLCNRDYRYFENKATKRDMPKVSVGLCVDQSGSMSGTRIEAARNAAICLYDLFNEIDNLDIQIYGHTTGYGGVIIHPYAEFGVKKTNLLSELASIEAISGNIDIVPITLMCEQLLQQDSESKVLFIISDGLPHSFTARSQQEAENELNECVAKYKAKGIEIIVAALGPDKERLEEIYKGQRFLGIDDVSKLPEDLVKVIKRKL